MANAPRKNVSKSVRYKILRETNFMCIYCGGDANQVDHIIPYSYSQNNDESNLIPTCGVCNNIASNKVFDSLAHKMLFIQRRRKAKKLFPIVSDIRIPDNDVRNEFPEHKLFDTIKEIKAYFIVLSMDYSYNEIAQTYGINKGVVWKIIKSNYEPKKNEIRRNLGLPPRVVRQRKIKLAKIKSRKVKPRKIKSTIKPINTTQAIKTIGLFIDKQGGINKGCKHVAKRLKNEWTWKYIYHVYSGRAIPGKKITAKLNALRPPNPPRKRHRKIIEATSKEQLEKWNALSANELRDALDNQTERKRT